MATGIGFTTATTFSGPFFDRGDVKVKRAIRGTTQDLVERGEQIVKRQLYPGHGLITGNLRRSVSGAMTGPLSGIIATPVVYGAYIEGVSRRNETTRFKGYSMFRKAAKALDKMAPVLFRIHFKRARLG
jgi:hypothetical protein